MWEYLSVLGALMGISVITLVTLVLLVTTMVQASKQDHRLTLSARPTISSMSRIGPWAYDDPYNDQWDQWDQWNDQYPETIQLAALSGN